MANFGVEWNRRNRETNRLAQEEQRRIEKKQRREEELARAEDERVEEKQRRARAEEYAARRTRIETRCRIAEIQFQLDPSESHRRSLRTALAVLAEYGDLF
ncbi:hypothetical protein [Synechocystis salina]